ncbi:GRAM domain-containing protein [Nocardioides yefusunii]|uniref:GRAM domain-containing protein n=1 Tax=Nocardioides yefusunii TaxID=2500546 RepID=A0ABW1R0Y2_9ACTN|nr:GRAM domain-containing protein [Nocardioides yefusunii]
MSPDLAQRLSDGPFWQLVRPVLGAGEEPVHHAHLRRVEGTVEASGTLFLTSHRLLWRSVDPRDPEGTAFEISLDDVLGVEQPQRFAAFHAFRVVAEHDARPVEAFFFPTHRNAVERHLCVQMMTLVDEYWRGRRSLRGIA